MKVTRLLMGMPITVEVIGGRNPTKIIERVFAYFNYVDQKFSTYKKLSEISQINQGRLKKEDYSDDMRDILARAARTKKETNGFFNIAHSGMVDPSGIVKGWAIYNAAKFLEKGKYKNFYIEAGGDIQVSGRNDHHQPWRVGIKNPFNQIEIVKVVAITNAGIATSGSYIRGDHIYNPHQPTEPIKDIISLTVIGPNIYEADRFATAAFAMGKKGIDFLESKKGFEGYMIDKEGIATSTSAFDTYSI